jgi:pyridoxamine 5'-phosphate oxidase
MPNLPKREHPVHQFLVWRDQAEGHGLSQRLLRALVRSALGVEPVLEHSAALATADASGRPGVRMVLVKHVSPEGFVFYTNYQSSKAQDLQSNPRAALVFHWPGLLRQVRVEGGVERLSSQQNQAYFRTRPRESKLAAWASQQSHELTSPELLDQRMEQFRQRFAGREVPCPEFWGGYLLRPERMEFWQGRPNRLHERQCHVREGAGWRTFRLMP